MSPIVPTREEFRRLATGGRLVPVYREVFADHDTPVSAFRKIDDGPYGFLLESVEGGETWGRYSILGSRPSKVFVARGDRAELATCRTRRGCLSANRCCSGHVEPPCRARVRALH